MGIAGDAPPTGQDTTPAYLPYPYAREAHLFAGYAAWAGRDFQHRLGEMERFRKDHPDMVQSPAWPFMLEKYSCMPEYITTSATQRYSFRLLDRNASFSRELGDFRSRYSICFERLEYDRVLCENGRLTARNKSLWNNRVTDVAEMKADKEQAVQ
ncbi:unnamed protein product [Cuscuta campestris]|uniref:Uncharacterized protein n=1 Tax=Cuscuta campestris TaxID=132261 RepID=A0A484K547_9ASTE|nr:unnamed protein product [Cuscuta campestris]